MIKKTGAFAVAVIWIACLLLVEGGSRAVYQARDDIKGWDLFRWLASPEMSLDAYEMPAPYGTAHWILRPGYEASRRQVVSEKRKAGRELGAAALEAAAEKYGDREGLGLRINRDGFKGPELLPPGSRFRILAIGDSVTFGLGADSYPRLMERMLQNMGREVEVVNAGVEGYSPRNVLLELPRYMALSPDLVTVYLGWNALWRENPDIERLGAGWAHWLERNVRTIWLARRGWQVLTMLWTDPQQAARRSITRAKRPDRDAPAVAALDGYVPRFAGEVEEIVKAFCDRGTAVVLVSLAGLYTADQDPSPKALKIGHMPSFTDNPFVMARMTERLNVVLRDVAGATCARFVDAAAWSRENFRPRDEYFSDSVHMTARGLEKFGRFLSEAIEPAIAVRR